MIICRVKNLTDNFSHSISFHRSHIVTLIKECHIKTRSLCRPKTKNRNALAILTCNVHIIRNSLNYCWVFDFNAVIVVIPDITNFTFELDFHRLFFMWYKPHVTTRKPEVRKFSLPTVNKLLLEDTIFIKNCVALCNITLCCKTIKITSSKTTKTTVTKTGIRLTIIY